MTDGPRTRPRWPELPAEVRARIEADLGARVLDSRSQRGGLSPGVADRLLLDDGRRVFVKAVDGRRFPTSAELHRREHRVVKLLPAALSIPKLVGFWDDNGWVALGFADAGGSSPSWPWRPEQLTAALTAVRRIGDVPAGALRLPLLVDELADLFAGWRVLLAAVAAGADPLATPPAGQRRLTVELPLARLHTLAMLAEESLPALAGDRLVHMDIRADNMILTATGVVILVDWPWASIGAPWFDPLCLVLDAARGGVDPDSLLGPAGLLAIPDGALTGAISGVAGYFLSSAVSPPIPGLPTLRHFQWVQGVAVLAWLARRLGWHRA